MGKKFGTKLTTKELNKLTRELVMLLSWHSSKEMIYRVGVIKNNYLSISYSKNYLLKKNSHNHANTFKSGNTE